MHDQNVCEKLNLSKCHQKCLPSCESGPGIFMPCCNAFRISGTLSFKLIMPWCWAGTYTLKGSSPAVGGCCTPCICGAYTKPAGAGNSGAGPGLGMPLWLGLPGRDWNTGWGTKLSPEEGVPPQLQLLQHSSVPVVSRCWSGEHSHSAVRLRSGVTGGESLHNITFWWFCRG